MQSVITTAGRQSDLFICCCETLLGLRLFDARLTEYINRRAVTTDAFFNSFTASNSL